METEPLRLEPQPTEEETVAPPPSPPHQPPAEVPPPPPNDDRDDLPPSKRPRLSSTRSNPQSHDPIIPAPTQQKQNGHNHPAKDVTEQDDLLEDEEEEELLHETTNHTARGGKSDLYLDTVNRDMLDFDFERLCSVTLSNINIYACLVCGKYFQGRSKISPAYAHSIGSDHHVFINLQSEKVYVLPDGYEVSDPSLDDIKYLLNPTFTPELLKRLDSGSHPPAFDLHGQSYLPGFVGLNNIKANDYLNVIVHILAHVPPLRDYLICRSTTTIQDHDTELVKRFSTLLRKLWNPKAFKAQVSPHEFGQEVSNRSNRRFKLTEQADPLEFLGWLLNTLHLDLGGEVPNPRKRNVSKSTDKNSSIIDGAFRGEVQIEEQDILARPDTGEKGLKPTFDLGLDVKRSVNRFLFLTIDLPLPPLFQDSIEKNIIPQVQLSQVLSKYDGITTVEGSGKLKRYKLKNLPPFLILHIKRFTSNNFVEEKNPTIVNFNTRGVDFSPYLDHQQDDTKLEKVYDLLANVTYSSAAGTAKVDSQWKVQVHTRPDKKKDGSGVSGSEEEKWFQIQDLIVEEVNRQMVFLGESYIQVWERRGNCSELEFEAYESGRKTLDPLRSSSSLESKRKK